MSIFGDFDISPIPSSDDIYGIGDNKQTPLMSISGEQEQFITPDMHVITKALDLGSGPFPKNYFDADQVYGIDIVDFGKPNIKVADLVIDPIPYEDNYFDYVTGFDFLEHVPRVIYNGRTRKQPFIDVMSEVWRVLKPGGMAEFRTPAYPHAAAFQDPQHVNIITEASITYFSSTPITENGWTGLKLGQMYGFKGDFILADQRWDDECKYHLIWNLIAKK